MAKELKKALKRLQSMGFRIENGNGSRCKVFPSDKKLPFYSLHVGDSLAYKPFESFAKKQWNIELKNL